MANHPPEGVPPHPAPVCSRVHDVYQALLTRRYLTRKIMPLLAACAVMLCTAMVLIVWSVMGGFLAQLVDSGRTVIGDVAITWPNTGFAYYDDLVERLEHDEMVEAACPTIETFGMANLPNGQTVGVKIKGVIGESFARVTSYADTLWWRPLDKPLRKDYAREDPRLYDRFEQGGLLGEPYHWDKVLRDGLALEEPGPDGTMQPAAVPGIELLAAHFRRPSGVYVPGIPQIATPEGKIKQHRSYPWNDQIVLSVMQMDQHGQPVDTFTRSFPIANEFHTGLYDLDHSVVLVEFGALQRMMNMDEAQRLVDGESGSFEVVIDPETGQESFPEPPVETDPARTTSVLVKGAKGVGLADLKARVEKIYGSFAIDHVDEVPRGADISIMTWEELNATMIAAVEKETALVLFLFVLISFVAVFLVLAIFWAMVAEKTKDIGILRSLGASRPGVAWLWLRYGAAIGVVGALFGGLLAYTIVWNINPIHEWLGSALGIKVWDPAVYYFTEIPNTVETPKAAIVLIGGVLSSLLGALVPAVRAASMDPVRALRFE